MRPTILLLVLLTFARVGLLSQVTGFTGREYRKAQFVVCQLGEFPVSAENRSYLAEYVLDYQVILKRELSRPEADSLRAILSDSNNYITTGMVRTCPFVARYGVKIQSKGATTSLVISQPGCIKMIRHSCTEASPRYVDLRKENAIYPFVEKLLFRAEE
jgi:hypothetical protein